MKFSNPLRRLVAASVRPVTSRVYTRVDRRIGDALAEERPVVEAGIADLATGLSEQQASRDAMTATIESLERRVGAFEAHLPFVLNTISSQNAAERESRRRSDGLGRRLDGLDAAVAEMADGTSRTASDLGTLDAVIRGLEDSLKEFATLDHVEGRSRDVAEALHGRIRETEARLEFVRRELLYELRYAGRPAVATGHPTGTRGAPPDADRAMLDAADDLRLNLGAGHIAEPGWTNVDSRELPGIEVVADVRALPCEPGTVLALRAAHLVEHFPEEELRRVVLPHWFDVLRPEGTLTVIVPDAQAMLREHAAGRLPFDQLRMVTFGEQEYEGDFHHTMFSTESLAALLTEVGFVDVEVVEAGRPNGLCLEMEVTASRPAG